MSPLILSLDSRWRFEFEFDFTSRPLYPRDRTPVSIG